MVTEMWRDGKRQPLGHQTQGYQAGRPTPPPEETFTWHSGLETYKKCPHDEPIHVLISPEVVSSVHYLCRATGDGEEAIIKGTEFMVYLLGEGDEEAVYVTDVYVPKQDVSVGSVKLTEQVEVENIVGVLHKHPGAGKPSFSHTDDTCLNVNHDVSIVIPSTGLWSDWTGSGRRLVQDGDDSFYVKTDLKMHMLMPVVKTEDLEEVVREKLKRTYTYGGTYGGTAGPYGTGGGSAQRPAWKDLDRKKKEEDDTLICPDCHKEVLEEGLEQWWCENCKQYLKPEEADEDEVNDDPANPWKGYE